MKFVVEFLHYRIRGRAADAEQTSTPLQTLSRNLSSFGGCSLGWSVVSLASLLQSISMEGFQRIIGPYATGKHSLPRRSLFVQLGI